MMLSFLIWLCLWSGLLPTGGANVSTDVNDSSSTVFHLGEQRNGSNIKSRNLTVDVAENGWSWEVTAWDGEVYLRVDLSGYRGVSPLIASKDIILSDYNPHRCYLRSDGNFEWEFILNVHPDVNTFTFPIIHHGLSFYYQDSLSSKSQALRPDSVIGSYAVYHASRANNFIYPDGYAEIYQTGKVCHLYRIKAIDALGKTVWGDQHITDSTWTITLPEDFLARATYPVIVDPTMGYTSAPASSIELAQARCHVQSSHLHTAGDNETIDSFYVYASDAEGNGRMRMAVYQSVNSSCDGQSRLGDISDTIFINSSSPQWFGTAISLSPVSGNTYSSAVGNPVNSPYVYYDDLGTTSREFHSTETLDNTWTAASSSNVCYGQYAVYHVSGTSEEISHRRLIINENQ